MNMRNYGLGMVGDPVGVPRVKRLLKEPVDGSHPKCPNPECGCEALAEIEVSVELSSEVAQVLKIKQGVGTYLSCPACPWASPMVVSPEPLPAGEGKGGK